MMILLNAAIDVVWRNSYDRIGDGSEYRVKTSCLLQAELPTIRKAYLFIGHHKIFHAVIKSNYKLTIDLSTLS